MTKYHVELSKNYKRIMQNHKLKIENLPILTEELSNDELADVKGGIIVDVPGIVRTEVFEGGNLFRLVLFGNAGPGLEVFLSGPGLEPPLVLFGNAGPGLEVFASGPGLEPP